MPDAAHEAEASLRALSVQVQALQDRLELVRVPASDLDAADVPAELLLQIAHVADRLGQAIGRALDRLEPGCGRDACVLAELMRRHASRLPTRRAARPATDKDAATI